MEALLAPASVGAGEVAISGASMALWEIVTAFAYGFGRMRCVVAYVFAITPGLPALRFLSC